MMAVEEEKKIANERISFTMPAQFKLKEVDDLLLKAFHSKGITGFEQIQDCKLDFDLSETHWHNLDGLLWFISLLNKLKSQRNEIKLLLPEPEIHNENAQSNRDWHFFSAWDFFTALSSCVDEPVNLLYPNQIQYLGWATKYYTKNRELRIKKVGNIDSNAQASITKAGNREDDFEKILLYANLLQIKTIKSSLSLRDNQFNIDEYLGKLYPLAGSLQFHCGWTEKQALYFINDVVREGIENSCIHGKNNFTNIAMNTDRKNIILVICDNGVGIPDSLRKKRDTAQEEKIRVKLIDQKDEDEDLIDYFTTESMIKDTLLIESAFRLKKTNTQRPALESQRNIIENQLDLFNRTGLYYLKKFVLEQKGELRIRSGNACVTFSNSKKMIETFEETSKDLINSPGTLIRVIIPRK